MEEDIQPIAAVSSDQEETPEEPGKKGISGKQKAFIILLIMVLVCGWYGIRWWIKGQTHIETDNAFIEAKVVSISSRVPGTVTRVLVEDNQHVKAGDLLVELDEVDYRVRVAIAEAGVGVAENETSGEYLKAEGARATLQLAKARLEQAASDVKRGEALYKREVIPKEQLERLTTAQRIAESQVQEAREALKRALAEAGLENKGATKAKVLQNKAQLDEARCREEERPGEEGRVGGDVADCLLVERHGSQHEQQ